MMDGMKRFHSLMLELEQAPTLGCLDGVVEGEFVDLAQIITVTQKSMRVRDAILDHAIAYLCQYFVISDAELARHLETPVDCARQAMLFLAGQLRERVALVQDNTRGWVMRLRWSFEEVGDA